MRENDLVSVTGWVISEKTPTYVTNLRGVVATVQSDQFKVWPENSDDPQLPKDCDGKLWFDRTKATCEVLEREDG